MRRVLLATIVLALTAATPASATAPTTWGPAAERIAAPWPDIQNSDGTYQDYVYGGDVSTCLVRQCKPGLGNARYAESVLGFGLLQTGVRTGDARLIDTALRSLSWVTEHTEYRDALPTTFETWAMASAYNLARSRIPGHERFRAMRPRWERWLKTVRPLLLVANPRRYFNHHLVEAVATFEMKRTGLRSGVKGAMLHPRTYNSVERRAVRTVEEDVHAVARPTMRNSAGAISAVVSDRPEYPLAYHGLTLGLYARAVELMGKRLSDRARLLLEQMSHSSWLLTAPDGDLAYAGRSQEESWALSATAYGATVAARMRGVSAGRVARWHEVADRAIFRLRAEHHTGSQGMWIVPALGRDPVRGLAGIDAYAGAAIFNGLTVIFLEYARAEADRQRFRGGRLAGDLDGVRTLNNRDDTFVTIRSGPLWYAIRQSRDMQRRSDDLRSDFGLIALKRLVNGSWRDVIPMRPRVESPERFAADSAGPRLRPGGGEAVGVPVGTALSANNSSARITTGWRMPGGSVVKSGTVLVYKPTECGVKLTLPVGTGDVAEYDVLAVRDPEGVSVDGARISDGTQTVTFSEAPESVRMLPGYASGSHPVITRARATFAAGTAPRRIAITTCGATPAG